jgi:periplasmic divalent cation tolerance protein
MKRQESHLVTLVTAPNMKVARQLARSALNARLAACVNLIPRVESHYWWNGRMEKSQEILMVFKTRRSCLAALEQCVLAHHPYEVPEFIALTVTDGNRAYLDWVDASINDQI